MPGALLALVALNVAPLLVPMASAAEALEPLECVIEPRVVVELSSEVDGVVAKAHVDRADEVSAGQLLAELESEVETATLALAKARASMDSDVRLQEVARGYEVRRSNRLDALYRTSALSLQEKDQADAELQLSAWKVRRAKDDQALARLEVERAEADLARRAIRSPIDGVVVERFVGPGETVEDQPLYRLAQIDPLNVEVIVPAAMYGQIQLGMHAEIRPEDPVGGRHSARVEIVDKVLDAASGTFGVRLSLPNPDHQLPAGLRCQVQFLSTMAARNVGDAGPGAPSSSPRPTADSVVPMKSGSN